MVDEKKIVAAVLANCAGFIIALGIGTLLDSIFVGCSIFGIGLAATAVALYTGKLDEKE